MNNRQLRIAHWGINGHPLFGALEHIPRARLVALGDVSDADLAWLARDFPNTCGKAVICRSFDELLSRKDIDLVVMCTSRRDHQNTFVPRALMAGMHVLAEKPLVTDVKALEAVKAAQLKSGKEVLTMTTMIYTSVIRAIKDLVQNKALGDIVQVFGQKSYPLANNRPQDRGIDGGIIQAAIHAVSFIRFATGLEFTEVFAQDTNVGNPGSGALQTGLNVACTLGNGGLATIVTNYCNPPKFGSWGNDQVRIFGTTGMVEATDGFSRVSIADGKEPLRQFTVPETNLAFPQDIIDYFLGGNAPLLTQEDGYRNTEIALKIQESVDTGKPVKA